MRKITSRHRKHAPRLPALEKYKRTRVDKTSSASTASRAAKASEPTEVDADVFYDAREEASQVEPSKATSTPVEQNEPAPASTKPPAPAAKPRSEKAKVDLLKPSKPAGREAKAPKLRKQIENVRVELEGLDIRKPSKNRAEAPAPKIQAAARNPDKASSRGPAQPYGPRPNFTQADIDAQEPETPLYVRGSATEQGRVRVYSEPLDRSRDNREYHAQFHKHYSTFKRTVNPMALAARSITQVKYGFFKDKLGAPPDDHTWNALIRGEAPGIGGALDCQVLIALAHRMSIRALRGWVTLYLTHLEYWNVPLETLAVVHSLEAEHRGALLPGEAAVLGTAYQPGKFRRDLQVHECVQLIEACMAQPRPPAMLAMALVRVLRRTIEDNRYPVGRALERLDRPSESLRQKAEYVLYLIGGKATPKLQRVLDLPGK